MTYIKIFNYFKENAPEILYSEMPMMAYFLKISHLAMF